MFNLYLKYLVDILNLVLFFPFLKKNKIKVIISLKNQVLKEDFKDSPCMQFEKYYPGRYEKVNYSVINALNAKQYAKMFIYISFYQVHLHFLFSKYLNKTYFCHNMVTF